MQFVLGLLTGMIIGAISAIGFMIWVAKRFGK